MQIFEDETFHRFIDYDSAAVFSDIEFCRCHFKGCLVSSTKNPSLRSTIRNVSLIDCTQNGSSIGTAIVEGLLIDNLKAPGLFQTFGAVFNRVVLRGKIDRLMITNDVLPDLSLNRPYQYEVVELFRAANAEYYRGVEWALDISNGEFKELDIRGVPSRLIRRDPGTQVVVTRENLVNNDHWRELVFDVAPWEISFRRLLDSLDDDMTLVVPKRHPKFRNYLEDLRLLRESGLTEPD